jgi:hypothetical protein
MKTYTEWLNSQNETMGTSPVVSFLQKIKQTYGLSGLKIMQSMRFTGLEAVASQFHVSLEEAKAAKEAGYVNRQADNHYTIDLAKILGAMKTLGLIA